MIIMGVDAGLVAPGIAIVSTSDEKPVGSILLAECFQPEWKMDKTGHKADIRKTDQDAWRIRQIVNKLLTVANQFKPDVIVAELPTGGAKSSSAIRGMAYSTSMTIAFLEALQFYNKDTLIYPIVKDWPSEVVCITPNENKKGGTGKLKWDVDIEQGKWEIMVAIGKIWPDFKWPVKKNKPLEVDDGKAWAAADALSCIATYLRRNKILPASA